MTAPAPRWARALFGCAGSDLPPEVVLLARLLAIAWLLTGHAVLLPTRSVPFFDVLTFVADSTLVAWAELVVGTVCAIQLAVGRSVRTSALSLGGLILLTTVLSRAHFSNNRLFTACLLVLVGLEASRGPPRLLRAQVVVLYGAAALDKLLDADWRAGVFMRSFASGLANQGRLWSPGHDSSTPHLPAQLFASTMSALPGSAVAASWAVMLLELGIALAFFTGRRRLAIGLGVAFHAGLLVYMGSPLGMFFYSATAAYFAFVELPPSVGVTVGPRRHSWVARAIQTLDPDGRFRVHAGEAFSVSIGRESWTGARGLLAIALRLPALYVALAVLFAGPWMSPWLALPVVPLALGLAAFGRTREPAKVVAKAHELNP